MTSFPAVTADQMADVDRIMSSRFGVQPIQLMEIAGYAVASFTRELFEREGGRARQVVAVAGSGGNGGDALVAARFLAAWGATVTVVLSRPPQQLKGLPAAHVRSVQAVGVNVLDGFSLDELPAAEVVLDGLLGFGAVGTPSGTTARLIERINGHPGSVLAIDVPSGIDATTGAISDPCVIATATITLGLPKTGLMSEAASDVIGRLVVADIGIPAAAYAAIGVAMPADLFSATSFTEVRNTGDGRMESPRDNCNPR